MTLTAAQPRTAISPSPPSIPRLRLGPAGPGRTLLDGGWWPRSTDPVAELPGLVLAIDALHGQVTRLMLHVGDWSSHPRRLGVAGRVVRLGYFATQPASLLTALCGRGGDRVDLLVVPPGTATGVADAAMTIAAAPGNRVHAEHIVQAVSAPAAAVDRGPYDTWESEGGRLSALASSGRVSRTGQQPARSSVHEVAVVQRGVAYAED